MPAVRGPNSFSPSWRVGSELSMNACFFFFSSRRRHTRLQGDWSSDVCSSDLVREHATGGGHASERESAMMRWIIGSSLKLRLVVATVAALLIVFGFTQLRNMPVDVLPEFSRPHVEIQVELLGLSAQEVEALITTPMEADLLNGTPWVKELRSVSIPGLASIVLVFEKGTDLMRARQVAQERLNEVFALPRVAKHFTMINPVSSAGRVMAIGVTSNKLSLVDMSVLARWTIQPRLLGVPGVANVSIWGRRERQLQVQVDPEKLRDHRVTLMQIIKTAGNARSEEHTSELQSPCNLVCRLLLEKKKKD